MSKLEKELREEVAIKKAKYRVKNSNGNYEVVYLETSADQVEQTSDRVFVTPAEKTQITTNKEAIAAETQARTEAVNGLDARLDVIEGEAEGSVKKALQDAKAYADEKVQEVNGANAALSGRVEALEGEMGLVEGKISAAKSELQGNIDTLAGKVSTNESDIANLKDAVANKNSNTIVVETEAEIASANPTPKVGDLAYVISSKRAYIFKGVTAIAVKSVPQGWVVFDEITSELDLVNYLKKDEANTTYRKLADKIAEADLATELVSKIDSKLDGTQVDSKISAAVTPVSEKADANESAIAQEVTDRQGEITRVEGLVTSVDGKVNGLSTSLTEKETALKAEDTKLNNRISKFAPVVAEEEPTETEAGHVWLQLV